MQAIALVNNGPAGLAVLRFTILSQACNEGFDSDEPL